MTRQEFYQTKAWKQVRKTIWLKQSCLCARCNKSVYVSGISEYIPKDKRLKGIVHHKEYLTDTNFNDINITLNEDNLEGICIDCHNKEHFDKSTTRQDLIFDENGNVVPRTAIPPYGDSKTASGTTGLGDSKNV